MILVAIARYMHQPLDTVERWSLRKITGVLEAMDRLNADSRSDPCPHTGRDSSVGFGERVFDSTKMSREDGLALLRQLGIPRRGK